MKNAILWKRILNQGLDTTYALIDDPEGLVSKIITSPIITSKFQVDSAIEDAIDKDSRYANAANVLKGFSGIYPPFSRFWIDWQSRDTSVPDGQLVSFVRDADGWNATIHCVISSKTMKPRCICVIGFRIDSDGRVDPNSLDCRLKEIAEKLDYQETCFTPERWALLSTEILRGSAIIQTCALLTILTIIGCKNVSLEPRDNDPKEVRRAIKRHGGNADSYRYHVLVMRPPGAKAGTKGKEIGSMPLHLCRGHSAEYGPEFNKGLLFGKYAGRFYIPPHMKGKKENGEVAKDYAVSSSSLNPMISLS